MAVKKAAAKKAAAKKPEKVEEEEAAVVRAGGHILRNDGLGWVVDDTPSPEPPKERPRKPLGGTGPTKAGGWVLAPEPDPVAPVPDKED